MHNADASGRPLTATRPFAATYRRDSGLDQPTSRPAWHSRAVVALASRIGQSDPSATPMVLEGPSGTVLAAVGDEKDHAVASTAVSHAMKAQLAPKLARAASYRRELQDGQGSERTACERTIAARPRTHGACKSREWPLAARPNSQGTQCTLPMVRASQQPGSLAVGAAGPMSTMSFGAVYEYRDGRGKPCFVGETSCQPEGAWRAEYGSHSRVRNLVDRGGRATLVWAGVGTGPCGHDELKAAREAIACSRAQRQQIEELRGAKPYSRHAHLVTML